MDFILKKISEEGISIDVDFPLYNEKLFIAFPKESNQHINNNKTIILKKKSINKEVYNGENILIYFNNGNNPEVYYINNIMT